MRFFEFLVENYQLAQQDFAASADPETVKSLVAQYRDLVNKNQFQGSERDINYWRGQGWDKFRAAVAAKMSEPTATQVKRRRVLGQSISLKETDDWLIVIPLDKDASCFHGRGTEWCTATTSSANRFNSYFFDSQTTLVYCIKKSTADRWALAVRFTRQSPGYSISEIRDQKDRDIGPDEFRRQTGLDTDEIASLAAYRGSHTVNQIRQAHQKDLRRLEKMFNKDKKNKKVETTNASEILDWLRKSLGLPNDAPVYFDNADLVWGSQTILDRAKTSPYLTQGDLLSVLTAAIIKNPMGYKIDRNDARESRVDITPRNAEIENLLTRFKNFYFIQKYFQANGVDQYPDQLMLAAVAIDDTEEVESDESAELFKYQKDPSETLIRRAAKINPEIVGHIDQRLLTPDLQIKLAKDSKFGINSIKDPDEAAQMALIKHHGATAIVYIRQPTEQVKTLALENDISALRFINNPDLSIILAWLDRRHELNDPDRVFKEIDAAITLRPKSLAPLAGKIMKKYPELENFLSRDSQAAINRHYIGLKW